MFKIPKMPKSFIKEVNKTKIILDNIAGIPEYVKLKPKDILADYEYKVTPLNSKGEEVKVKSTYYSKNKEKVKESHRQYNQRTIEERKAWQKKYYATHIEQQKLKHKIWYQKTHMSKLRIRTLNELREFAINLDDDMKCPEEYFKYNRTDTHQIEPKAGGRAWLMFILDKFEKEKNGKHK